MTSELLVSLGLKISISWYIHEGHPKDGSIHTVHLGNKMHRCHGGQATIGTSYPEPFFSIHLEVMNSQNDKTNIPWWFQPSWYKSSQQIIIHRPRFPWNQGSHFPSKQLPFGVRDPCEVAIFWPESSTGTDYLYIPAICWDDFCSLLSGGPTFGWEMIPSCSPEVPENGMFRIYRMLASHHQGNDIF